MIKRLQIISIIFFLLIPTFDQITSTPHIVIYVTYPKCPDCPSDPMQKIFEQYFFELWEIWGSDIQVRKIDIEPDLEIELTGLYQKLGVPNYIPTNYTLVVSINEKYLFINQVPVNIISDFMDNNSEKYGKIIVYKDEMQDLYHIIDDVGNVIECRIEDSIEDCLPVLSQSFLPWSTLSLLIISGFLDGINPCAFAVMLFMITLFFIRNSSLKPHLKQKNSILLFGLTYIMAVYLTYLTIGLTLRKIIDMIPFPHMISKIGSTILIMAGVIKLNDHFRPNSGISLKLSQFARLKIATVNVTSLPATFAIGILVALSEFPCTGGIYVAIISKLATKTTFLNGIIYLIIYNFAFVIPLIAILIISTITGIKNLSRWQKQRKEQMELLEGLIYISLGFLLLLSDFI